MAFGIPPKYELRIKHGLTKKSCEKKVQKALDALAYLKVGHEKNAFDYRTRNGIMTMGERFLVYVGETEMLVISKSINPGQFIDFGRNKQNVERFMEVYRAETV